VTRARNASGIVALVGIVSAGVTSTPAFAHHSFAMYDQTTTKTMTGRLTRFVPGGNHAQLHFDVLEPDGTPVMDKNGKPLKWGVETGSAVAIARQGVTVESFKPGIIFTVTLYPLRDGRPLGAIAGPIIKCGMTMPTGGCTKETGQTLTPPAN
jgi:hypothetical protein